MRVRFTELAVIAALVLLPGLACAQSACVVLSSDIAPYREAARGFSDAFRGKVAESVMGDDPSSAGKVAAEVNDANCAVVVAMGSQALRHLRLRIQGKPIVFAMTLSPSAGGIAGKEITGVYLEPSPRDTLAALKRIFPNAASAGVLHSPASAAYMQEAETAAQSFGLKLNAVSAASTGDAVRQLPSMTVKSDVLWMIPDPVTSSQGVFKAMLESSLTRSVPIFALSEKHVSAGALAALSTNYFENGKQAGALARRVALGTSASSLPPEYARDFGLALNLKTAQRLGFEIPEAIVREAAEVYR